MKYFAVSLLALTAGGFASYCAAQASQNPAPPPEGGVIRSEVTRVNMLFAVTDKKGRFITDLKQDDLSLREQEATKDSRVHFRKRPAAAHGHPDRHLE